MYILNHFATIGIGSDGGPFPTPLSLTPPTRTTSPPTGLATTNVKIKERIKRTPVQKAQGTQGFYRIPPTKWNKVNPFFFYYFLFTYFFLLFCFILTQYCFRVWESGMGVREQRKDHESVEMTFCFLSKERRKMSGLKELNYIRFGRYWLKVFCSFKSACHEVRKWTRLNFLIQFLEEFYSSGMFLHSTVLKALI